MRSWLAEPARAVDPDEARRAAQDILARPEYREPQPSLVDRAFEAIADFLGRAIGTLTGGGAGSVIGSVITGLVLALAVWLLVRAVGTPWRRRAPAVADAVVQGTTAPTDPDTWRQEAERLARAGDLRGALRCRYQALVAGLVRDRVVDDVPGRTATELRRELGRHRPDLDATLASVTERFEQVWYGGHAVDAATYQRFGAEVEAIESADLRRPAVPA